MSDLDATNYNRNYLFWTSNILQRRRVPGGTAQAPIPAMSSGTTRSSRRTSSGVRTTPSTASTTRSRDPDEKATSNYGSFEAEYAFSDALHALRPDRNVGGPRRDPDAGRLRDRLPAGTRRRLSAEWHRQRAGLQLRRPPIHSTPFPGGTSRSASAGFSAPSSSTSRTRRTGPRSMPTSRSTAAPGQACSSARATTSTPRESLNVIGQGPLFAGDRRVRADPRTIRTRSRTIRPTSTPSADRSRRTSGTGRRRSLRTITAPATVNRDPVARARLRPASTRSRKRTRPRYVQANFGGSSWSGNIGLRYVQTDEHVVILRRGPDRPTRTRSSDSLFGPFKRYPGRQHV